MIHQFIFAGPKPGLPAEAFKSYWVNFHAVDYAVKIPQIRQYLVATRVPLATPRDAPLFEGVAEIWLNNESDQIASLQSPEFLLGARTDEPRWAAFWQTFVLDTDPQPLTGATLPEPVPEFTKLYILLKRRPGLTLEVFRQGLIEDRTGPAATPGLVRHSIGFARQRLYGFGEPRFDAIEVLSFRDAGSVEALLGNRSVMASISERRYLDDRYIFYFTGQEHWLLRPGERQQMV